MLTGFACERSGSAKLEIQSIELDLKVVDFLIFYTDLNLVFVESFVHFIWSNIGQKSPFLFQDLVEKSLIGWNLVYLIKIFLTIYWLNGIMTCINKGCWFLLTSDVPQLHPLFSLHYMFFHNMLSGTQCTRCCCDYV